MIIRCLLKYGWHGVHALMVCLEDEIKNDVWKEYTANFLCLVARPNYESKLPLYSELLEIEKVNNNMTTDEIIDNVVSKLDEIIAKKGA